MRTPNITGFTVGQFSVSISWSSSGPVVTSYEVEWQRHTSGDCSDEHSDSTTINSTTVSGSTERYYDIMGLFGNSSYSIRVRATNDAGSAISDPLVISTDEAGISLINHVCNVRSMPFLLPQLPQLHLPVLPHSKSLQRVSVSSGRGCHVSTPMEKSQATQYWYKGMGACKV